MDKFSEGVNDLLDLIDEFEKKSMTETSQRIFKNLIKICAINGDVLKDNEIELLLNRVSDGDPTEEIPKVKHPIENEPPTDLKDILKLLHQESVKFNPGDYVEE